MANSRMARRALWRNVACPVCNQPVGIPCHFFSPSESHFFHRERAELAKRTARHEFGDCSKPHPTGEPIDLDAAVAEALAAVGIVPSQPIAVCRRCPTHLRAENRGIGLCGKCQDRDTRWEREASY